MFTKETALTRARQFLADCSGLPIKIDRAILFGSMVSGKLTEESDIDLALFSKQFSNNILHNIDLIGKVNIRYPEIDVHTFSTGQKGILLDEILEKGIELTL